MASNNVHSGSDVQQQSSNQKAPEPVQQVMNKSSENRFFTTFGYWVCCKFCDFALLLYVQINPKPYQVLHRICIWCAIECGFEFCSLWRKSWVNWRLQHKESWARLQTKPNRAWTMLSVRHRTGIQAAVLGFCCLVCPHWSAPSAHQFSAWKLETAAANTRTVI